MLDQIGVHQYWISVPVYQSDPKIFALEFWIIAPMFETTIKKKGSFCCLLQNGVVVQYVECAV